MAACQSQTTGELWQVAIKTEDVVETYIYSDNWSNTI